MQDGRSKVLQRLRGSSTARGTAAKNSEARVQKLAKKLGNEEIATRIRKGEANRELMLAFIGGRLQTAREAQLREIALTHRNAHWENWRSMADSHKPETTKPNPNQWRQVAESYDLALKAICQGDLARGKQLIDRAMEVEERVWSKLTDLVETGDLEAGSAEDPSFLQDLVADTPTTSATAEPVELRRLIDEMLISNNSMPDPMNRRRRRDPWWTLEEEEEEEEGGDGGGAGG